ncbi:methyltransferase domain-containing protein [Phormidium tenue FACHB-886]|nr:methyltransferase domain-containing protein [Phormidium tenue FACHB-886]
MSHNPLSDNQIITSWHQNARPWTIAVREGQIESRKLVTNGAIVEAVLEQHPKNVLDLGCGEGWLARTLAAAGIEVFGVDVVPELIKQAQAAGGGRFEVLSYEAIAAGKLNQAFDIAVSNFALLGQASVVGLFKVIPSLLTAQGCFIVQTIHPLVGCGEYPYEDGWREGSWAGFSNDFSDPAPWYFRTLESWMRLYSDYGFKLQEIREPLHPQTGEPASVILIGSLAN